MTSRSNPPSAHRVTALAIAAALATLAGVAHAQPARPVQAQPGLVSDSAGNAVRSASGDCVRPGQGPAAASVACPPAASATRTAAAGAAATGATGDGRAAAARSAGGATQRPTAPPGYAASSDGRVVLNGFGTCVRAGHWAPGNAAEPCDRIARADVPPVPVVAAAPEPKIEPAPAPAPAAVAPPEPPRPVIQKLTLSTDVLFDFNSAELKEGGKRRLDQLADEIKDADVDEIVAVGHADRIASEDYNLKLSEARAQAVKDYLAQRGAKSNVITAQGKGESQPVTGDDCKKLGAERASNRKLVACLQPDRRVEIEVLGSRQVAGGQAPAAGTGTTGTPSGPAGSGSSTTR